MNFVGPNELWVVIDQNPDAPRPDGLAPAVVFKKHFDAVLAALLAADRELHVKAAASEFDLCRLTESPCEFGFRERPRAPGGGAPCIDLFRRCAVRVYRSDYRIFLQHRRLMRAFQRIALAVDPSFPARLRYADSELPLDQFFRRQVDRAGLSDDAGAIPQRWYSGVMLGAYVGRLQTLDYRGAAWTGRLALAGAEAEIVCAFDRSKGEDAFNRFGNKDVSIIGRAIFTGDSALPERLEVLTIEEVGRAAAAIDIRGTLCSAAVGALEHGLDHLDKP